MSFEWEYLIQQPQHEAAEVIKVNQLTREFYQEVEQRQEFERYCQWYYETAAQHQQELKKMRNDINILGWFLRG